MQLIFAKYFGGKASFSSKFATVYGSVLVIVANCLGVCFIPKKSAPKNEIRKKTMKVPTKYNNEPRRIPNTSAEELCNATIPHCIIEKIHMKLRDGVYLSGIESGSSRLIVNVLLMAFFMNSIVVLEELF